MNYGSNDRAKKTNQNLTERVSSELLGVLPSNIGFENNYANVREAYDWALTDLEENTVELSLPIDTLISLQLTVFVNCIRNQNYFLHHFGVGTIFDNRNHPFAFNDFWDCWSTGFLMVIQVRRTNFLNI